MMCADGKLQPTAGLLEGVQLKRPFGRPHVDRPHVDGRQRETL